MQLTKCAVLFVILGSLAEAEHLPLPNQAMTIRVLDQAKLSLQQIHQFEHYVTETLASIKVDVKWVNCAEDLEACKTARGPNEFWLRILGQMSPDAGPDQLGFAQPGGPGGIQCVNIFYPMVQRLIQQVAVDANRILGAAVAHEIGHLYLGPNLQAHSLNGVMCGVWSRREVDLAGLGELKFTGEQGARIRAAMNVADSQRGDRPAFGN